MMGFLTQNFTERKFSNGFSVELKARCAKLMLGWVKNVLIAIVDFMANVNV